MQGGKKVMLCWQKFFMKNKKQRTIPILKKRTWIIIWGILLLLAVLWSLSSGSGSASLKELFLLIVQGEKTKSMRIMLYIRLPRVLGGIFAGAGLAVSGVIIQSVLNNSLAGPNIIGVNAGAGFAVALTAVLIPGKFSILPIAAFLGALVTVLLVFYVGKKTGASKVTLVLAGIAVNSILNAATDTVLTFVPDAILNNYSFRIGGLGGINSKVLYPACICIGLGTILAFCLNNEMDVLSLGEDTAKNLGLNISWYRLLLLIIAAILAGASVSFAGLIGFVGLIIPHMSRILVGAEGKYLIPTAALMGAACLTFCDFIARRLFAPYDISVGIILSFLGAPFFLYLLVRKKGKGIYD